VTPEARQKLIDAHHAIIEARRHPDHLKLSADELAFAPPISEETQADAEHRQKVRDTFGLPVDAIDDDELRLVIQEAHRLDCANRRRREREAALPTTPKDDNHRKQLIVAQYISTDPGRKVLAHSMTQPKRCGGRDYAA